MHLQRLEYFRKLTALRWGCKKNGILSQPANRKVLNMGSTRQTAGLPAIDVTSICDAALKLTKEFGIDGWSVRQLAKEINAYPGVINYHVGRREDVVHLVIEHVNAEIDLPEPRENWKRWFKLLLEGMRSTLRKYPGVARRLAAVGPGLGESDRIINCGIQVLRDAGFGDWSTLVYSVLLCQTCAFVATEDDRDKMDDVRKEVGVRMRVRFLRPIPVLPLWQKRSNS